MKVIHQDILKIVEKASTLTERLSDSFIASETQHNKELISHRWGLWSQTVAKGNLDEFAKRLAWDELYPSTLSKVLGSVSLVNPTQLPVWAKTLWEVLQTDWEIAHAEVHRCLNQEKPIPFEEIYLPFVYIARQRLIGQVGTSWELLSDVAQISLEHQLLSSIGLLFDQPLSLEFSSFQALQYANVNSLEEQKSDSSPNKYYKAFVQDLKTRKLLSFCQEYSALARLVVTKMDFWVQEKSEFIQRLALDLSDIQETFEEYTGQVVAVKLNLSDPHNQGRSVIALTFASGLKLVYKPRSLGLEVAYFQLLTWCNQQQTLLPFKLLKVINRSTYGWMEYAEQLSCLDQAAAQRYYLRAGMLLCLTYVLGGNDFHKENLVACGEHPVLVDLETLVAPQARIIDPKVALAMGAQHFANSVLKTELLPTLVIAPGGQLKDMSGLGGVGEGALLQRSTWQNVNTDSMALKHEYARVPAKANTLLLDGIVLSPSDYVDDIACGFEQMYQFLKERQEELLASDSPLNALANQEVRFLFRGSQLYDDLLEKTLQPKFLKHGVERSIQIDVLSRALLATDEKPYVWPLLAVEQQALEQMDIPYFIANSSSDALEVNSNQVIKEFFEEPSLNQAISRLQQLSDADLAQQITLIRGSLYPRISKETVSVAPTNLAITNSNSSKTTLLTPEQLLVEAVEIGKELQKQAIYVGDNVTWLGMAPCGEQLQFQPLGDSLYDGVSGIALFLAALAKITGAAEFRDLALNALQTLRKTWQEASANSTKGLAQQIEIGGAAGAGSIIYTLVRISQFLDEPSLLETASHVASCINQESIASDSQLDTMGGTAGAILGLLTLYKVKPDPSFLEKAGACGHHLLNKRVKNESGFKAWANFGGQLATGFSHGASGIAYALLRLYQETQEPAFLEAASEAIAYIRSVFSTEDKNWPVSTLTRGTSQLDFMVSWCHGAPGIALAYLGGLEISDSDKIRQEIAVALSTTQQFGLDNIDFLCCGNFGRVEAQLVAAQKLSYPELWEKAQKQAAQIVSRKNKLGAFYLFPELPAKDVYNPGFFRGTAGIGYQLLRLAYRESLPSVLLWE